MSAPPADTKMKQATSTFVKFLSLVSQTSYRAETERFSEDPKTDITYQMFYVV